ncbi:DUF4350 domain-containing protein [Mycolicibacterium sp. XJ1819]
MSVDSAVEPTVGQRLRGSRYVVLAIAVVVAMAAVITYLTAPRPGARMDPTATSADGAHALVTLLREHGVEVVEATDIAAVERAARPDTLTVVVQTYHLFDEAILQRLADLPGDRLLVEPTSRTREKLAPALRVAESAMFSDAEPDCDLREANRAGSVQLGLTQAFEAAGDTPVTRCYGGALVRYLDDGREMTVVGTAEFMTNGALLDEGNAALAMNLTGTHPRMIWYAPQFTEAASDGAASIDELIPDRVSWIVLQLVVTVMLLALWKGRRIGPLVAERLPVVVRASETVEGRGRLYRSHRSRDRAAEALRTAALQRMRPRLGLGPDATPATVVGAVATHCTAPTQAVAHTLFGPPPSTDDDLVNLAHELDNIERQVAQS